MANSRLGITQAILGELRAKGIDVRCVNTKVHEVHGIPTELISAEDAERVDVVVCGYPPAAFPDEDLLTWCHDCACAIVHRPHAPKAPIKLCVHCARRRLEQL
jgi:hypothetical protein